MPVDASANLLSALLNSLIRQRGLKLKEVKGIKETAIASGEIHWKRPVLFRADCR
ncbi:MAG: hypothetical protein QNL11_01400 [Desulfobacterales bacterium]|nr:hypothetical protein [Desulfobacterales bacterium]